MPEQQDETQFPEKGILWRGWGDETLRDIAQRAQPVLLFVADPASFVWPFLREIFKAMPANGQLRALLHESFIALHINADALPEFLKELGAGSRFHIAILSPYGLTPMATFDPVHGNPAEVVDEIALALERITPFWPTSQA
jgi:hypothetical protein